MLCFRCWEVSIDLGIRNLMPTKRAGALSARVGVCAKQMCSMKNQQAYGGLGMRDDVAGSLY